MSYKDCKPINGAGNHPRGKRNALNNGAAASTDDGESTSTASIINVRTSSLVSAAMPPSLVLSSSAVASTATVKSTILEDLVESPDATCGEGTKYRCPSNQCCSQYGWVSQAFESFDCMNILTKVSVVTTKIIVALGNVSQSMATVIKLQRNNNRR